MPNLRANIIPLLCGLALIGLGLMYGLSKEGQLETSGGIAGKPLPEFSLPTLEDPQESVQQSHLIPAPGQHTIVYVFAQWCVACRRNHQDLDIIKQAMPNLKLAGLNYQDKPPLAVQWIEKHGNPFDFILSDPKGITGPILGIYGLPSLFVIGADGIVKARYTGSVDKAFITESLLPFLDGP